MEVFEQNTSDNKYLHRDFHISMNMLMGYILGRYGRHGLTEYLKRFSGEFHSVLKERLRTEGLMPLAEYLREIYKKEEWEVKISVDGERLVIKQESCPGMTHIRENGYDPVDQYVETYTTVYGELCRNTPYKYKMIGFNEETGACEQVFVKRGKE